MSRFSQIFSGLDEIIGAFRARHFDHVEFAPHLPDVTALGGINLHVDEAALVAIALVLAIGTDSDAVRVLYEDIDNDQRSWNARSALVLAAAALAAFNLIS